MSEAAALPSPVAPERPSARRRITKIVVWVVGLAALLAVLNLIGVDVWGWLEELWDSVKEISLGYIILGCFFQCLQTVLHRARLVRDPALRVSGRRHLHAGARRVRHRRRAEQLPAREHRHVRDAADVRRDHRRARRSRACSPATSSRRSSTSIIGTLIYVYLFLEIAGSFDFQFGDDKDRSTSHPALALIIIGGGILLIVILCRIFWGWVKKMWAKAKTGAAILGDFRAYMKDVAAARRRRLRREDRW